MQNDVEKLMFGENATLAHVAHDALVVVVAALIVAVECAMVIAS